jgi:hypothetical protein
MPDTTSMLTIAGVVAAVGGAIWLSMRQAKRDAELEATLSTDELMKKRVIEGHSLSGGW